MAYAFLQDYRADEKNANIANLIERTSVEINIPEGVTKIGNFAFCGCSYVVKFTIPDSVKEIGNQACNGMGSNKGTVEIIMPDSITTMGANAFVWSGVKKFVMSKNIAKIEANTFGGCSKCEVYDFTRYESVPTLANVNAFDQMTTYKKAKIYVPAALYSEWMSATNWAEYAEYIKLKQSEGLSVLYNQDRKYYCLAGRGSFEGSEIVIPESYDDGVHGVAPVMNFELGCFGGDDNVTVVFVPETISSFNYYAFSGCPNLKKIYIPGVSSVSSFEFSSLSSLEYVKFGKNIRSIGGGTFTEAVDAVYDFSEALSVPNLNSYGRGEEFGTRPCIKVPANLLYQWQNDTNWSIYADCIMSAD